MKNVGQFALQDNKYKCVQTFVLFRYKKQDYIVCLRPISQKQNNPHAIQSRQLEGQVTVELAEYFHATRKQYLTTELSAQGMIYARLRYV